MVEELNPKLWLVGDATGGRVGQNNITTLNCSINHSKIDRLWHMFRQEEHQSEAAKRPR